MNALKEWATVVHALESGDQTVLLRKGGILETASGFVVQSKKFLLFPTYEHQSLENIKPEFSHHLEGAMKSKPQEGKNKITSYAEVISEADVSDMEKIKQLSKFHIWSDSYIKTRMDWMPQKPMKAIFLRVYKIDEIPVDQKPEYQGCKSWIDINANFLSGKAALSESDLAEKRKSFEEVTQ